MHTGTLRILCISPNFPPMADPEGFCGAKMIMALTELGCDVTVLRMDLSLQPHKAVDESPLWKAAVETSLGVRPPENATRARSVLSVLRYQTESYSRWVDAVVREALSRHRAKPFDLVYSRSLPMVAHVAGYWCAKALHRPWVAGINDPWDAHLFPGADPRCCSRLHAAMSQHWLCKTVRSATLVTYPSDRLRDFHVRLAGRPHRSVIVPHIGYACDSVPQSQPCFHLLHAGMIGRRHRRSAAGLLTGLKQFLLRTPGAESRTQLTLVGPEDAELQSLLTDLKLHHVARSTGRVPYQESLRHIARASVCVLVEEGIEEGIYLPSKLADYVAARRPVLALSPAHGVIADLLPRLGMLRVNPDDVQGIAQAMSHFYQAYTEGTLEERRPAPDLVSMFMAKNVAKSFLATISETVYTGEPVPHDAQIPSPRGQVDVSAAPRR